MGGGGGGESVKFAPYNLDLELSLLFGKAFKMIITRSHIHEFSPRDIRLK